MLCTNLWLTVCRVRIRLVCCCPLRVCTCAYLQFTHVLLCCTVSTAVLNNAKNLKLTTEQTQWGLSAQDRALRSVLNLTFVPSPTEEVTVEVLSTLTKITLICRMQSLCFSDGSHVWAMQDLCSQGVQFYFFLCCRSSRVSRVRISTQRRSDKLLKPWLREEVRRRYPTASMFQEQVRNINSSSSCGPLLRTCGRGYELAWARPLSTMATNVSTLPSAGGRLQRFSSAQVIVFCHFLFFWRVTHWSIMWQGVWTANSSTQMIIK